MRKLVFFMHVSLDGYVAGKNGELNWVYLDDTIFDFVGSLTDQADMALYGRVTYKIMEKYWPTAAERPNATKHDIKHSKWYNKIPKIVISKTINSAGLINTTVIRDNIRENVEKLKSEKGKNILIFGSPTVSNLLLYMGLIDEFWLFVNPVILGQGIPLFKGGIELLHVKLLESKNFNKVIALHYSK